MDLFDGGDNDDVTSESGSKQLDEELYSNNQSVFY